MNVWITLILEWAALIVGALFLLYLALKVGLVAIEGILQTTNTYWKVVQALIAMIQGKFTFEGHVGYYETVMFPRLRMWWDKKRGTYADKVERGLLTEADYVIKCAKELIQKSEWREELEGFGEDHHDSFLKARKEEQEAIDKLRQAVTALQNIKRPLI